MTISNSNSNFKLLKQLITYYLVSKLNYYESILALSCDKVSSKCYLRHMQAMKEGAPLVIILKGVTPVPKIKNEKRAKTKF